MSLSASTRHDGSSGSALSERSRFDALTSAGRAHFCLWIFLSWIFFFCETVAVVCIFHLIGIIMSALDISQQLGHSDRKWQVSTHSQHYSLSPFSCPHVTKSSSLLSSPSWHPGQVVSSSQSWRWEEAGGNPHRHAENIQTPHRQARNQSPDLAVRRLS